MNESAIKAVGLFGGGIAGSGFVCGALVGGIAALSSVYSRGNLNEKEDPAMRDVGRRLVARFEHLTAQYGSIQCSDIARVDWKNPAAVQHYRSGPHSRRNICIEVVGETAQALGEILDDEGLPR